MTSSGNVRKRVRPLLGTFVTIELRGRTPNELLDHWISDGFAVIEQVHRLMSFHDSKSDLMTLNRAAPGDWIQVDRATAAVLRFANRLFLLSKGFFDIRCGARLTRPERRPHPLPFKVAVELQGMRVRKTGPWTLDLGGIAKGYAVDAAVRRLKRVAASHSVAGLVNAGGDLRTWGARRWTIGVQLSPTMEPQATDIGPSAVATSWAGRKDARLSAVGHLRMPSQQMLRQKRSAVVFASTCMAADALTKVVLMATPTISKYCLRRFAAHGLVTEGRRTRTL